MDEMRSSAIYIQTKKTCFGNWISRCVASQRVHCTCIIYILALLLLMLTAHVVRGDEGSVIVAIEVGESIDAVAADYGATVLERLPELGLYRVTVADYANDARVLSTHSDTFLDARPSYVVATGDILEAVPLAATIEQVQGQESADQIRLPQAQTQSLGAGITVAVLDTGVEFSHPLLQGHVVVGVDFVDGDESADDAAVGADTDGDFMLDEGAGHGTHVAGIIALVAPDAEILPVRIFDSNGRGSNFNLARGIVYAVAQGADVINLSGNSAEDVSYVQSAINYATTNGVVVVAAAGLNEIGYPAGYENVVSVAAVDSADWRTVLSNFPEDTISVYAPGQQILSAYYGGRYARWTGHSMATPFVAGTAALMLATGGCSADCVQANLRHHARPINNESIGRRVDAYDAVGVAAGQTMIDIEAQSQQGGIDVPTDNVRKVVLKLDNFAHSLPLDELTLRYWYTNESAAAERLHCDWAAVGCENVSGLFGIENGEQFFEISFGEGVLFGSDDSGEIHIRTHHTNWAVYDETNDWSYNSAESVTTWERVTLYHDGDLVWGEEPFGVPTAVSITAQSASTHISFLVVEIMMLFYASLLMVATYYCSEISAENSEISSQGYK